MKIYIFINKIAVFLGVIAISFSLNMQAHAAIDLLAISGIKPATNKSPSTSILALGAKAAEDPSKAMATFRDRIAGRNMASGISLNDTIKGAADVAVKRSSQQIGIQQGYIAQSQQAVGAAQGFWKAKIESAGSGGGGLLGGIGDGFDFGNFENFGGLPGDLSLDSVTEYAQNAASGYIGQKVNEMTSNATSQMNGVIGQANGYIGQATGAGQSLVSQGQSILSTGQKVYSTGTEIYDKAPSFGSSSGWLDINT